MIAIRINRETFRFSSLGNLAGEIYFDFGNEGYYPSKHWSDFPARILGWWMIEFIQFRAERRPFKFEFMDGPRKILCKAAPFGKIVLIPETREKLVRSEERIVSEDELRQAVIDPASQMIEFLSCHPILSEKVRGRTMRADLQTLQEKLVLLQSL